jgi:hypothetical protein
MVTSGGIDQLRADPHAVGGAAHAPFDDVGDAKLARDVLHLDRLALEGEG